MNPENTKFESQQFSIKTACTAQRENKDQKINSPIKAQNKENMLKSEESSDIYAEILENQNLLNLSENPSKTDVQNCENSLDLLELSFSNIQNNKENENLQQKNEEKLNPNKEKEKILENSKETNEIGIQTSKSNTPNKILQNNNPILSTILEKITEINRFILSIRKKIDSNKMPQFSAANSKKSSVKNKEIEKNIEIPVGHFHTGNLQKEIKISPQKIQRVSELFEDSKNSKETLEKKKTSLENFDSEFEKILSKKHTSQQFNNSNLRFHKFVTPKTIPNPIKNSIPAQDQNLPTKKENEFIALLSDIEFSSSPSKKPKIAKISEQTIIDQSALILLKGIISQCEKIKAPVVDFNKCVEKLRKSKEMTISECENFGFNCYCMGSHSEEKKNLLCTLCGGTGKIGYVQIYNAWSDLLKNTLNLEWVKSAYKLFIWKFQKFDDTVLTIPNLCYKLSNELLSTRSFFYNVLITNKYSISQHCVLQICGITSIKNCYILELTDGHYILETIPFENIDETNDGLIHNLIKNKKIQVGDLIHVMNAKFFAKENKPKNPNTCIDIMRTYRLHIYYNSIAPAKNRKLGIQEKGWIYKSITNINKCGGPIFMLDAKLLSKVKAGHSKTKKLSEGNLKAHFVDTLSEQDPEKANIKAEILIKSAEHYDILEEGKRYKIFGLIPRIITKDLQRSGVLYLETDPEITRVIECPEFKGKIK